MAVIGKKNTKEKNELREVENGIQLESTIIEKTVMFNSSCRIVSFQYSRACTSKANLHLIQGKSERKQKYLCATFTLVYT